MTPAIPMGPLRAMPRANRTVKITGRTARAIDVSRSRLLVTGVVFGLAFLGVGVRLIDVSLPERIVTDNRGSGLALSDQGVARGSIVDRNGTLLATDLPGALVFAEAPRVIDPEETADRLREVLPELDRTVLLKRLNSNGRKIVLHRELTPAQHQQILRMGLPGIDFETGPRRHYPQGAVAAHVVGFTGHANEGRAGIEKTFDDTLIEDRTTVALSIDIRLQALMRRELLAAMEEFQAIGAAGIILDAHTGEILSLVSLPDFSPYDRGNADTDALFNRASLGVYEMGSTFKLFTAAMALDSGVAGFEDGYDASKPLRAGGFRISDYHAKNRWLSVPEIIKHSSNIGSALMALDVGSERQQDYLRRLGLMDRAPIEVSEVGRPKTPAPWREINTMTISYGHGMAVSPVNLVSAVAALVNGGVLHPPTLLARPAGEPVPGTRVLSERTSDQIRRLMRLVVTDGTGGNADAEGYLVGGKTGTSEKILDGRYSRSARMSSFVAAFPMTDPRYVVFAMLDEPQGNADTFGFATGGWVAAPVIGRVIEQMGPMMGVMPQDPDSPDVHEALDIDRAPTNRSSGGNSFAALTAR